MHKKLYINFLFLLVCIPMSAQFVTGGVGKSPYKYTDNLTATNIEAIYVLNTLSNAEISYNSANANLKFYYYTNSSADKQEIPASDLEINPGMGTTNYKIRNLEDSRGYGWADASGKLKEVVWIVDYTQHRPELISIEALDENPCESLKLMINKSDRIYFYGTTGGRREIIRRYSLKYLTQQWSDDTKRFVAKEEILENRDIGTEIAVNPPLLNTEFEIEGDQFGYHFRIPSSIKSASYEAVAVEGHIVAEQEKRESGSESENDTELGGSAPAIINFYGYSNEPVTEHYTWLIYHQNDFENYIARYTDRNMRYEFHDAGKYTVKLELANKNSICVDTTSLEFSISESSLDAPNYFSPGHPQGYHSEFRVAYKSLVKFKCTIFNRWGNKLYEWTDPAQGWDGKYRGKYVSPGVYFYVIEATGSDGIKYKKSGDINILRSN